MKHLRDIQLIELASHRTPDMAGARRHLETCADCRRRYEQFRDTHQALGLWEVGAAASDLWPAIERRVGRPRPGALRAAWASAQPLLRVAAALLLGIGLGYGTARAWKPERTPVVDRSEDVDQTLGLHALARASPVELVRTVAELTQPDVTEDLP